MSAPNCTPVSDPDLTKTGVYRWRNTLAGKCYVGSAGKSLLTRKRSHLTVLRHGKHRNKHLQHAFQRDGEAAFAFEVLEYCPPKECVAREQQWIDTLKTADRKFGYNLNPTAGSRLGAKMPENAERNRARCKGVPLSEDHRAKVVAAMQGRTLSAEHRAALSAARKGMKFSAEHRANISKGRKGVKARYTPPVLTPELRAARSAARKGKPGPNKGGKMPEEHRKKLCGERKGRRGRQKLTKERIPEIRKKIATGVPVCEIAAQEGVTASIISNIKAGRIWAWVP